MHAFVYAHANTSVITRVAFYVLVQVLMTTETTVSRALLVVGCFFFYH